MEEEYKSKEQITQIHIRYFYGTGWPLENACNAGTQVTEWKSKHLTII